MIPIYSTTALYDTFNSRGSQCDPKKLWEVHKYTHTKINFNKKHIHNCGLDRMSIVVQLFSVNVSICYKVKIDASLHWANTGQVIIVQIKPHYYWISNVACESRKYHLHYQIPPSCNAQLSGPNASLASLSRTSIGGYKATYYYNKQ